MVSPCNNLSSSNKVWDDGLARVAQKWADQCADVDYKGDHKRRDPSLFHDSHPNRKIGRQQALGSRQEY